MVYKILYVVANNEMKPEVVLVRTLEPADGIELVKAVDLSLLLFKISQICA